MEDIVGLLASAIVTQVGANLGTAVGDQVTLLCTYKDDLKDMKETLKSMEAVLKDAEGRSLKNGEVRLWLKRLKNVALDISDMLDEFDTNNDKNAGSRKMMGMCSSPTIAPKISVACKMKTIRERLKKIKYEHDSFSFNSSPNINEQQISDRRETTSKVNQADVVGRDNEKNYIIGLLSASNCKETVILPIHGFGGMGKTTLAQLVYNDDRFREYDHRVWVYVSQVFELKEIGNSIIAQVSKEGRKTLITLQEINLRLNELLCGKETLIVLDDIWEENEKDLDELKLMLDVDSRMTVIVTTRREDISRKVCSKSITPYELKPLDKESCWQIINKTSHFETKAGRKELEQIGRDIANKCGGIPLAAKSLGCMLRDNTEWSAVRDSDIWNEYSPADNNNSPQSAVISSLKLTYKIMPPYLRLCFAYCAIFPKGHSITSNDLIHQWISLDFIKQSNMLSGTQLGNKCVRELLAMSFLQHSGLPSAHMILTVHDMVHEVARSVMNEDLIVFDGSGKKGNNTREQEDCRYALLTNCEDLPKMSTILLAKLRALHFRKCCKLEICGEEFSFFKCLRVLDLTECSVTMFPTSVGRLKQLRYLIAPKLQNPRFPKSIVQLSKLQYLSLHGSSQMLEIPESIVKIKCLMHIDLSNCSSIIGLPETLCGLTTLEYLNLSNCSNLEKLPEDLGSLTKLQFLNLSGCDKIELPKSTGKLTNLVHLDLSSCSNVKNLPKVLGGLTKLKYLNLSNQLNYIWRSIECISALTNLEHLDLSDNDNLIYLPESLGMLKKLHTLDLSGCRFLQSLPAKISEMHSLKFLFTARCSDKLKNYLTQHRLGKNIVSLPHFVVRLHDDRSCSNLHQLEDINPKVLEISCLENVRYTEEAKGIAILEKHNLSTLAFHWTPNADRLLEDKEVLGELVPPIDVKDFELKGYGSIQFPIWLMGISHYLPNLVAIKLQDLSRCSELPPLGQLPNLAELHLERLSSIKKINGDFCGGNGAFCKLLDFSLWDMEVLEEWITKYHDKDGAMVFMFPKLCTLSIRDCPRMTLKPCPPIFEECWSIERSDKVISSYSISSIREGKEEDDKIITCSPSSSSTSFTPIRTIRLVVVSSELPLVQWRLLHYLPILEELEIRYCHHLAEFPDGTEVPERCDDHMSCKLASLKSQIRFCDHMKEPADCKPPKQSPQCDSHVLCKLTSLKSLIVRRCNNITSLPDCIQKLTGLKRLEISYNPELMQWCDLERNKKLFHIQQVNCWPRD